jgi:hypothetical protein
MSRPPASESWNDGARRDAALEAARVFSHEDVDELAAMAADEEQMTF